MVIEVVDFDVRPFDVRCCCGFLCRRSGVVAVIRQSEVICVAL